MPVLFGRMELKSEIVATTGKLWLYRCAAMQRAAPRAPLGSELGDYVVRVGNWSSTVGGRVLQGCPGNDIAGDDRRALQGYPGRSGGVRWSGLAFNHL